MVINKKDTPQQTNKKEQFNGVVHKTFNKEIKIKMLSFILLLLASSTLQPSSLRHLISFSKLFYFFFQRPWLPTKKIFHLLHHHNNNNLQQFNKFYKVHFYIKEQNLIRFFIIAYWRRSIIWIDHGKGPDEQLFELSSGFISIFNGISEKGDK